MTVAAAAEPAAPTFFLLAGSNGAGKSTPYYAALADGLIPPEAEFVNADLHEPPTCSTSPTWRRAQNQLVPGLMRGAARGSSNAPPSSAKPSFPMNQSWRSSERLRRMASRWC